MTYVNPELHELFSQDGSDHTKPTKRSKFRRKNEKTAKRSKRKFIVIALILIFVVWPAITSAFHDQFAVAFYSGSEQIKQLADKSGMNTHGKALFYSTNPEIVDYPTLQHHCPGDSEGVVEYGCFLVAQNKIYILNIPDQRISGLMAISAGHEMLHKAFSMIEPTEKATLTKELNDYKLANASNKDFNDLIQPYIDIKVTESELVDEIDSLVGTEVAYTNDALEANYSKYFSNRQLNPNAESDIKSTLAEISDGLTSERSRIEQMGSQLDHTLSVTKGVKAQLDRDEYYGNIYNYNLNVPIYNKDVDIYNSQLSAYNNAVDSFNAKLRDYQAIFSNLKAAQNITSGI